MLLRYSNLYKVLHIQVPTDINHDIVKKSLEI